MRWRVYGALVQFGCYRDRYEQMNERVSIHIRLSPWTIIHVTCTQIMHMHMYNNSVCIRLTQLYLLLCRLCWAVWLSPPSAAAPHLGRGWHREVRAAPDSQRVDPAASQRIYRHCPLWTPLAMVSYVASGWVSYILACVDISVSPLHVISKNMKELFSP